MCQAMTLTFSAWGPFWPWVMSNSTFCPFLQAAVAATRDRAEVHEHVRAALHRDETVALIAVGPLHRALRHLDLLRCGCAPAMAAGVQADSRDCSGCLSRQARGRKPCGWLATGDGRRGPPRPARERKRRKRAPGPDAPEPSTAEVRAWARPLVLPSRPRQVLGRLARGAPAAGDARQNGRRDRSVPVA